MSTRGTCYIVNTLVPTNSSYAPQDIDNFEGDTTDVIRIDIKNEPKISRQITHCKGFRPHTALLVHGMLVKGSNTRSYKIFPLLSFCYAFLGSEADSHGFVLEIPTTKQSEVIYLTAPTTAEASQNFQEILGQCVSNLIYLR